MTDARALASVLAAPANFSIEGALVQPLGLSDVFRRRRGAKAAGAGHDQKRAQQAFPHMDSPLPQQTLPVARASRP